MAPGASDEPDFLLPRLLKAVEQHADVFDRRIARVDRRETRGLDAVFIMHMAQRKQVFERVELTVMAAGQHRRCGQLVHELAQTLLRRRAAQQQRRVVQRGAVGDKERRAGG